MLYLLPVGFVLTTLVLTVAADDPNNFNLPEPTPLQSLVQNKNSEVVWTRTVGVLVSAASHAEVDVIEVEGTDGSWMRGLKLTLTHEDVSDEVYIPELSLLALEHELERLATTGKTLGPCSSPLCIFGVARCRPSQQVTQACCPGLKYSGDSKKALFLETPRRVFYFPGLGADQLRKFVTQVIEDLKMKRDEPRLAAYAARRSIDAAGTHLNRR